MFALTMAVGHSLWATVQQAKKVLCMDKLVKCIVSQWFCKEMWSNIMRVSVGLWKWLPYNAYRNRRFELFSVGNSVHQVNKAAYLFIFYISSCARLHKEWTINTVPKLVKYFQNDSKYKINIFQCVRKWCWSATLGHQPYKSLESILGYFLLLVIFYIFEVNSWNVAILLMSTYSFHFWIPFCQS